jgi:hypothetical protein
MNNNILKNEEKINKTIEKILGKKFIKTYFKIKYSNSL